MTTKLYDNDSYQTHFEAKVVSCTKCDKGYETILDRTAFFPKEGGQCCDTGTIDGIRVTDVQIKGNTVYHYMEEAIPQGKTVIGKIDFALRFRNMQNHTGEHIICGIAHRLYGYENVGFHLGADYVTMDLSGPLTKEQTEEIEMLANEVVFKNLKVNAYYPPKDMLDKIDYRCKAELTGDIRIVEIENCDICACCAPHVARTGEVGLIKIIDSFPHRGGMRLTILCGYDALNDYRARYEQSVKVSNLLSVRQGEIADGVKKLLDDMGSLRHLLGERSKAIARVHLDAMAETRDNVCIFEEGIDKDAMRTLANGGMKKTAGIIAVMSGNESDGYSYIMASESINLKEKSKEINSALSGRGGGSQTMIQGTFAADKKTIEDYIMKIK